VGESATMNAVAKVTSMSKRGDGTSGHRNFKIFLEEIDFVYGNVLLHTSIVFINQHQQQA
jgi:hypothetical protein